MSDLRLNALRRNLSQAESLGEVARASRLRDMIAAAEAAPVVSVPKAVPKAVSRAAPVVPAVPPKKTEPVVKPATRSRSRKPEPAKAKKSVDVIFKPDKENT